MMGGTGSAGGSLPAFQGGKLGWPMTVALFFQVRLGGWGETSRLLLGLAQLGLSVDLKQEKYHPSHPL